MTGFTLGWPKKRFDPQEAFLNYVGMMDRKRDVAEFGARLLSEYRKRKQ